MLAWYPKYFGQELLYYQNDAELITIKKYGITANQLNTIMFTFLLYKRQNAYTICT